MTLPSVLAVEAASPVVAGAPTATAAPTPAEPDATIEKTLRAVAENALGTLTKAGRGSNLEILIDGKTYTGDIAGIDADHNLVLKQYGHKTLLPMATLSDTALADLLNTLTNDDQPTAAKDYLTAGLLYAICGQSNASTTAMDKALALDDSLGDSAKKQLQLAQALFHARTPVAAPVTPGGGDGDAGTGSLPSVPAGAPVWLRPAPLIRTGSWANVLKGPHPRLLGGPGYLRALVTTAEQKKNLEADDFVLSLAIRHAISTAPADKIQVEIAQTMKDVAAGVTNLHQDTWVALDHAACTFDYFYDQIPPADRAKIIAWMNGHLGTFDVDESTFSNSALAKIMTYIHIAYATWGDNPRAAEFRDYGLKTLYEGKVAPGLVMFGKEGGLTDCGWYNRYSIWDLVQGLELARRVEKTDPFQAAPEFFYHRLAYEMYQPFPGEGPIYHEERYAMEGDGATTYGGTAEYSRQMRTVLAQYFRGSPWSRYIQSIQRPGTSPSAKTTDMFWFETPEGVSDPTAGQLSLAYCATTIGKVYARDSWKADATWFRFVCANFWSPHQHFDVGHFEIFNHADLATPSGEYISYVDPHSVNYLIRSIAHNTILVYQPGEIWKRLRDGKDSDANDGGQNKKWDWPVQPLADWLKEKDNFHRGDIVAFQSEPDFMYVSGDCTPAYSSTKLTQFVRQIVFVHPGLFVIFDRVISTKPEYEKTWLLHCFKEPQIAGNTVTVTAGEGKEVGTLTCQTLLPENPTIRKVYGYTYHGLNFPEADSMNTPLANKWRIEVLPSKPATEDLFVHVLSTVGTTAPPAKLIRDAAQIGADITTATGKVEVRFSANGKCGGSVTINGHKTALATKVEPNKEP